MRKRKVRERRGTVDRVSSNQGGCDTITQIPRAREGSEKWALQGTLLLVFFEKIKRY